MSRNSYYPIFINTEVGWHMYDNGDVEVVFGCCKGPDGDVTLGYYHVKTRYHGHNNTIECDRWFEWFPNEVNYPEEGVEWNA